MHYLKKIKLAEMFIIMHDAIFRGLPLSVTQNTKSSFSTSKLFSSHILILNISTVADSLTMQNSVHDVASVLI